MGFEQLWAGWRSEYINQVAPAAPASHASQAGAAEARPDCVFDAILSSGLPDRESHVLWRHADGLVVALLNAYPYTTGHLMVMPTRHVADLEALTPEESGALWAGVSAAVRAVKAAYSPDGLNMGANLGAAAGAGVPGHFHVHVLPRWRGDTNFMTSLAGVRVLPESLDVTDDRLRAAWPAG
jgi:diadenosine tetraphosphate (Ap4A) HIT family hydrolase